MKWLLVYAYFTCTPTRPLTEIYLPAYQYYQVTQPAFTSFEGNKKQTPFSWNAISIKDFSCTFVSLTVRVNKKGKFTEQLNILYLNVKSL